MDDLAIPLYGVPRTAPLAVLSKTVAEMIALGTRADLGTR